MIPVAADADAPLVARLKRREEGAFDELLRLHGGALLRLARRFLGREEDARDAVQDAFVAAFRSLASFDEGCRLSTWLHRITVNACLMRLRSRRRHPEEELEVYLPRFLDDGHQEMPAAAWCESAESVMEKAELCDLVRRTIERLPETHRIVLLLRDIEEIPNDEVAKMLEITPNAVKIRLHRARQALRGMLDSHMRGGAR
jgi:RNA polymerase sigma-70 factor (ECF subfamily)